jgi:transposase
MFTGNEDMEATALREQGWSISAIARHLGRDRKTIRAHLNGTRVAGERRRSVPDPFDEYVPYLRARFNDDVRVFSILSAPRHPYDARGLKERHPFAARRSSS